MYENPIQREFGEIQTKIIEAQENYIMQAVRDCGVTVDKEELIKALQYDRQQYEKGYADAKAEMGWIPCSERWPEKDGYYLTTTMYYQVYRDYWNGDNWDRTEMVIAWMPLPEPWKGEDDERA